MATTIDTPKVLRTPFASQGDFNEVPQTNDQTQGLVSVAYGFPPITSLSVETEGGIPPKRRDMNGALNLLSTHNFSSQNGGIYTFNQDVSDAIGGYAKGAVLGYVDSNGDYFNLVSLKNNNTANFNTNPSYIGDGVNWKKISADKYMTNCLLEVPQDIKLELNNGTLTLKAGSKVYVPNGAGKFDVVTISADKTITTTSGGIVFINSANQSPNVFNGNILFSGSTAPTGFSGNAVWYNTTNNVIKNSANAGSSWENLWSFPIAKVSASNGTITSIENVFNGVGYIGSTVFVLPNVVGLVPNGRNADGSLKNKLAKTQNIVVFTEQNWTQHQYQFLRSDATGLSVVSSTDYNYDIKDNLIKRNNGSVIDGFVISECDLNGGVISNFNSKKVFQALDYNYLPYLWSATKTKTSDYSPSVVVEEGDGYIKFSSGVMIQWGVSIQTSGFPVIVLPQPYIDANYTACTFSNAGSGGDRAVTSTYGFTTTQYQCRIQNSSTSEFRFMTIGRWK